MELVKAMEPDEIDPGDALLRDVGATAAAERWAAGMVAFVVGGRYQEKKFAFWQMACGARALSAGMQAGARCRP
ncbi:MAG: hypothetical protein M3198_03490 [Actinomycetota bacterium]|nr:hypothetical protein [Actinomycetota bacterium]